MSLKNADLIDCWISAPVNNKLPALRAFVESKLGINCCNNKKFLRDIRFFHSKMSKYWRECKCNRNFFNNKYSKWLSWNIFDLGDDEMNCCTSPNSSTAMDTTAEAPATITTQTNDSEHLSPTKKGKRGRPRKSFTHSSKKTKNRKVSQLTAQYSLDELELATKKLKTVEVRKCLYNTKALALYLELDLSERKYNILRKVINDVHPNCLPSLYALRQEKRQVLPIVTATENSAEVNLKSIMRRTAEGVLELSDIQQNLGKFEFVCKWGMDGSSGHSRYKQQFTDHDQTDEFMFIIAFVPIKMVDLTTGQDVWTNPTPSSTNYCRPVKFCFSKESRELVQDEYKKITEKINSLECDVIDLDTRTFEISYKMHCTMIDGAVANILTMTNSCSRCFFCNARPTEMNKLSVEKIPNVDNYKFGLSTLHCWIKFFECVLHIAYRLPFKKWRVGKENEKEFSENKARIQAEFQKRTGLLIDMVKCGTGTTNDGNTARRFFSNSYLAAEITGINRDLIENFGIILRVLCCGKEINKDTFKELLRITRNNYIIHYGWYYMPSSVHKVLVHGCDVIGFFDLPIGSLSEEALEATHKIIRKSRLNHTRKNSRKNCNTDLMNHLLIMSDPTISSNRHKTINKNNRNMEDIAKYIITTVESTDMEVSGESTCDDSSSD